MYNLRVRLAGRIIQLGLFILPSGRYKEELITLIYGLKEKVISEVRRANER